jgi:hypothetical protein
MIIVIIIVAVRSTKHHLPRMGWPVDCLTPTMKGAYYLIGTRKGRAIADISDLYIQAQECPKNMPSLIRRKK